MSNRRKSRSLRPVPANAFETMDIATGPLGPPVVPAFLNPEDPMSVTDILSIQLYTLRSLEDLDLILDTVAGAGYRNVETVGSHLDKAVEVRTKLDARGLKASSSHVSLAALREKPDAVVDACKTLGLTHLYMPAVPPNER